MTCARRGMARPLRMFESATFYFITDRCHEERHFLRPDPEVLEIVARALRKAIGATGVATLAWVLMSNHWHLIVRVPNELGALPAFMQRLKSEVARAMNEHLGRQEHSGQTAIMRFRSWTSRRCSSA